MGRRCYCLRKPSQTMFDDKCVVYVKSGGTFIQSKCGFLTAYNKYHTLLAFCLVFEGVRTKSEFEYRTICAVWTTRTTFGNIGLNCSVSAEFIFRNPKSSPRPHCFPRRPAQLWWLIPAWVFSGGTPGGVFHWLAMIWPGGGWFPACTRSNG